jgi:hypothetical protein
MLVKAKEVSAINRHNLVDTVSKEETAVHYGYPCFSDGEKCTVKIDDGRARKRSSWHN